MLRQCVLHKAFVSAYLIISKQEHDVQQSCQLQLLLTCLIVTLSLAAPTCSDLANLHTDTAYLMMQTQQAVQWSQAASCQATCAIIGRQGTEGMCM